VYTGKETKIQMNMTDMPVKMSNIERRVNSYILMIFFLLFMLCMIGSICLSVNMSDSSYVNAWYLAPDSPEPLFQPNKPGPAGVLSFFALFVLLSLLVPISFYVSIELIKLAIQTMISSDREMYSVQDDQKSLARSRGLCEELGQVSYIFSDKTGTLTQNLMEFKKCSIGGVVYGRGFCEVERAIARRNGKTLPDDPTPPPGLDKGFNFVDERLLFGRWQATQESRAIENFLVNMAVNHNVQVEYTKTGEHKYEAESPDEGAFVQAARNMGFFFSKREIKDILIKVAPQGSAVGEGSVRKYVIKQFNPFDNNRKRTSLVVQTEDGSMLLLVKGADASVMPFIDEASCPYLAQTQKHIDEFGEQGLRTLVFAGRKLDPEKYAHWNGLYQKAALLPDGREAALRQLAAQIEEDHDSDGCESVIFDATVSHTKSLLLHGVSALEDRLQENVGHCISQLAKAMIKIWVLTGDKLETAINIGFATALLQNDMQMLRMSSDEMLQKQDGRGDGPKDTPEIEALEELWEATRGRQIEAAKASAGRGKSKPRIRDICEGAEKMLARVAGNSTPTTEILVLESRVKEALIKERVHNKILSCVEATRKERPGGYALVIDGPCLRVAVSDECKMDFLKIGVVCKAVVCCRVTPAQKAAVTLLVKDNMPGQITLAIGDGANDVAMIQAAHLGIGIRGKEGQQAVLASDYALPRFAYLERLLLVHGRWCYNRIGTFCCYFFYKNIIFALTLWWFNLWNGFSSQSLYDEGYQSTYNTCFTAFPVLIFAVLDRDLEPYVVAAHPELYSVTSTLNSQRLQPWTPNP
jgi:magnesium-transporting ATPase (P-type)